MCDFHIPQYAYKENHIRCNNCSNYATSFMVDCFIPSNYEQSVALSTMRIKESQSEIITDAKGFKQSLTKVVGNYIPWFAKNSSEVPFLVPACNDCHQQDKQYIHCHFGFQIYKTQKERFNSGSPYYPWIKLNESVEVKSA